MAKRYRRPQTRHVVHEGYKHYTDRTRDYEKKVGFKEVLAIFMIVIAGCIIYFSWNVSKTFVLLGFVILIIGVFWIYKLYKKGRKGILRQRAKYEEF